MAKERKRSLDRERMKNKRLQAAPGLIAKQKEYDANYKASNKSAIVERDQKRYAKNKEELKAL